MTLTAIDAFSGCGGLTVGLKRAGFRVVAAIEIEPHAFSTYKANHPEVKCALQDIGTVAGGDLLELANTTEVDLLAGCPPCQGFTSLTSKFRKRVDPRNALVLEMARLAEEMQPRAVMMENVPGLTKKGKALYGELRDRLESAGYTLTEGILNVVNFGVPQFRRRLVLLGGLGFEIGMPEPTHADEPSLTSEEARWRTVRDAIEGMDNPLTLTEAKARGEIEQSDWHIVRTMSPENVERIKAAKAGKAWTEIPEKLRPACHREDYIGFTNVYGRMQWDRPAPTITGGCTTLSKGRFGHPEADRTISVREAALLQTFPAAYMFDTPYMDHACNMIGNALPCDFAEAVSRQCAEQLIAPTSADPR